MFLPIIQRAFSSNLRHLPVTDGERSQLEAVGIAEPTIYHYLVWRRSVLIVVVLAAVLGALLGTVREFGLVGEENGTGFERLWDQVVAGIQGLEEPEDEDDMAEAAADEPPVPILGQIADAIELAAPYALGLAALAAAGCWSRANLSYRIVVAGWLIAFFVPIVLTFCPWNWWGVQESTGSTRLDRYREMAEGIVEGAQYFILLLPTLLSLGPGVQRACLRLKTLLPESTLPGWFLVTLAPFSSLLSLVIFVAINQVVADPRLLLGIVCWVAAPLVYVVRAGDCTKPLATDEDFGRLRMLQRVVLVLNLLAAGLLGSYLLTQQAFGERLLGLDGNTSFLHPLDLLEWFLEFIYRSLFMTVLGADVFLRMNLAMWRQNKDFQATPAAPRYDQVMSQFQELNAEQSAE